MYSLTLSLRSNAISELWTSYQSRLSPQCFYPQVLRVADLFYEARQYRLARTLGYWKCLLDTGLQPSEEEGQKTVAQYASNTDCEQMILAVVSALRSAYIWMYNMECY